jgi:hypothetical protein
VEAADVKNLLELSAIAEGDPIQWGHGRVSAEGVIGYMTGPTSLYHLSSDLNGVTYYRSLWHNVYFYGGWPLHGMKWARKYDLRVNVTYPVQVSGDVHVWIRPPGTVGFSGDEPSFQMPWAAVVPGSESPTGCQVQTFVFEVDDPPVQGWFPAAPDQIHIEYSIMGVPVGLVDAREGNAGGFGGVAVHPNPFRGVTHVTARWGAEEVGEVRVLDVAGRVVRHFYGVAGGKAVAWNGRGDDGLRLGSGVYWVEARCAGRRERAKVVLVR